MVTLHFEEHHSLGYPDQDKSVEIPETGDLPERDSDGKSFLDSLDKNMEPKVGQLREHYGARGTNQHLSRSFPAVELHLFYMVWIEGRHEWVGVKFHYLGCDQDLDGHNECIETGGPFRLDERCAELIRKAYDVRTTQDVLRTSPTTLEKALADGK